MRNFTRLDEKESIKRLPTKRYIFLRIVFYLIKSTLHRVKATNSCSLKQETFKIAYLFIASNILFKQRGNGDSVCLVNSFFARTSSPSRHHPGDIFLITRITPRRLRGSRNKHSRGWRSIPILGALLFPRITPHLSIRRSLRARCDQSNWMYLPAPRSLWPTVVR